MSCPPRCPDPEGPQNASFFVDDAGYRYDVVSVGGVLKSKKEPESEHGENAGTKVNHFWSKACIYRYVFLSE